MASASTSELFGGRWRGSRSRRREGHEGRRSGRPPSTPSGPGKRDGRPGPTAGKARGRANKGGAALTENDSSNPEWEAKAPEAARRELQWHLTHTYAREPWAPKALDALERTTNAALALHMRREIRHIIDALKKGELL